MSEDVRFMANPDFLCREIAGEYMLVAAGPSCNHALSNQLVSINETGYFVWSALQEPIRMDDLYRMAKEEFHDSTGVLEEEIYSYVMLLVEKDLVLRKV